MSLPGAETMLFHVGFGFIGGLWSSDIRSRQGVRRAGGGYRGTLGFRKRIALQGGITATITPVALRCATKLLKFRTVEIKSRIRSQDPAIRPIQKNTTTTQDIENDQAVVILQSRPF